MSENFSDTPEHDALHEIPVESLGLSEAAIKVVLRMGMTTVGDCVDFFVRGADAMIPIRPPAINLMYNEVKPKLEEHGYWPPDASKPD